VHVTTPPPSTPGTPDAEPSTPRPRPLWFYWAFGGLWVLIGVGDLIAQRANLFGLGPVGIGIVIWIIGLVAARRRTAEQRRTDQS
jgi:hypothetical protein